MKNRISWEYVTRMKEHIFADFMYYRIVIVENTQEQYFDNLIGKFCVSVLNNDNTVQHQVSQYNELFLVYILWAYPGFYQNNEMEIDSNLPIWKSAFYYNL